MSVQPNQICQKCHATISPEQIASKQAGTVRGIWLCPNCVEGLRKQVAAGHSGVIHGEEAPAANETTTVAAASSAGGNPGPDELLASNEGEEGKGPRVEGGSAIRTLASRGPTTEYKFRRPLAPPEKGATRVHTFHARMSTGALQNMDHQINEWLDTHPDIYIKNVVATVGVFEAKMQSEEHLLLSLFY